MDIGDVIAINFNMLIAISFLYFLDFLVNVKKRHANFNEWIGSLFVKQSTNV